MTTSTTTFRSLTQPCYTFRRSHAGPATTLVDLVVEVVSPGDTYAEVEEKVFDWLEAPGDIKALADADVLDGPEVVPGFELTVREIFT